MFICIQKMRKFHVKSQIHGMFYAMLLVDVDEISMTISKRQIDGFNGLNFVLN